MNFNQTMTHERQLAVTWAAQTLAMGGAILHPVTGGWDVEFPDGSWGAANSSSELCALAHGSNKRSRA